MISIISLIRLEPYSSLEDLGTANTVLESIKLEYESGWLFPYFTLDPSHTWVIETQVHTNTVLKSYKLEYQVAFFNPIMLGQLVPSWQNF